MLIRRSLQLLQRCWDYRTLLKFKPQIEIAALRSTMPDEALQVIRYMIDPQIPVEDKHHGSGWTDFVLIILVLSTCRPVPVLNITSTCA